jgi:hypothetical protein
LIAPATVAVALAITAAPVFATTDVADYAAQVNPICQSANAQQKQLYESFEQAINRLHDKPARGKKGAKIERRIDRLFTQLPIKSQAVLDAEFSQLKNVPPAPGDEGLVSDWLAIRQSELNLGRQLTALEIRIEKLFNFEPKKLSIRAFNRQDRREKRLEQKANRLYKQLEPLGDTDLELGTRLGATYCVTGATGTVVVASGATGTG